MTRPKMRRTAFSDIIRWAKKNKRVLGPKKSSRCPLLWASFTPHQHTLHTLSFQVVGARTFDWRAILKNLSEELVKPLGKHDSLWHKHPHDYSRHGSHGPHDDFLPRGFRACEQRDRFQPDAKFPLIMDAIISTTWARPKAAFRRPNQVCNLHGELPKRMHDSTPFQDAYRDQGASFLSISRHLVEILHIFTLHTAHSRFFSPVSQRRPQADLVVHDREHVSLLCGFQHA
jgi:hypothetical protein